MKTILTIIFCFTIVSYSLEAKALNKKQKTDSLINAISKEKESNFRTLLKISELIYDSLPDKAIDYCNKAIKLAEKNNQSAAVATAEYLIASAYFYLGNYKEAQIHFSSALKKYSETNDTEGQMKASYNVGYMYRMADNLKKSAEAYHKSYELALKINKVKTIMYLKRELAEIYYELGKYKPAIEYYQQYFHMRDSAESVASSKKVSLLETKIEIEKTEKQKVIEDAKIKQEELAEEVAVKEEQVAASEKILDVKEEELKLKDKSIEIKDKKVAKQRKWIILFTLGSIGLLAYIFLLYRMYKDKKKNNRLLSMQNEEIRQQKEEILAQQDEIIGKSRIIEIKNHEILQSIEYSLRIQKAMLPDVDTLKKICPNSFVIYKPKDIVSGDFYWFRETKNNIIIAAVDCTGHGVPGAFMSLIGMEKLSDVVSETEAPGEILQKLNIAVKTVLKQNNSENSTRDGMDAAICVINKSNGSISYSGANRPLWFFNGITFSEIKATKAAIGGLTENNQEYIVHNVTLKKGDTFYIFSDGYADQFGGPEGKKMMTKRFKELLGKINSQAMNQQKNKLEEFFAEWKNSNEQVDDVLVIGIKI